MNSNELSLNIIVSQVITFIFCRNDNWLLHIKFFCWDYYILFWSLRKLQRFIYITFGLYTGLGAAHWAKTDYGLSAGQV